eukprot:CAMPEP_0170433050 /NCGR_PEP_ID=MMETSP0117_2-20130122/42287_1 /TAXON_ID=400756 /ORGANISM="Durinskia baltica, Strain CSIRO CS-38" /LENGTH=57 /DNA_ID=CAMNT_0010692765 /DNA_START=97 /DNA_END=266 /DNA_ORIENTATION=+
MAGINTSFLCKMTRYIIAGNVNINGDDKKVETVPMRSATWGDFSATPSEMKKHPVVT